MSARGGETAQELASRQQRRAAQPTATVWVSASAGSGKTKVLTDRVLTLLLGGTRPERILCLTFTRAAAAEMANRLAGELARWVVASEEALAGRLAALLGREPTPDESASARALFARVLEAPGGLKIATIHAFCESLLARFPLEAGLAPHFKVLDERAGAELLAEARLEVLAAAARSPEEAPELSRAVEEVAVHMQDESFRKVLDGFVGQRPRFNRARSAHGGWQGLGRALFRHLGASDGATPEESLGACLTDAALDRPSLERIAAAWRNGTARDQANAEQATSWLAGELEDRVREWPALKALFFTTKDQLRQKPLTKGAAASDPGAEACASAFAERIREIEELRRNQVLACANRALLTLAEAVLEAYERRKRLAALMDYDDLVLEARALLRRPGVSPWVLYKLDGGLDHVMIDEAQDTSPEQWAVVAALTEEFFSGEGARDLDRTVFAVGDAKQSIYSFQGADPRAFDEMRQVFRERAERAKRTWTPVSLEVSFRSTAAVLQAVDAVFADEEVCRGVISAGDQAIRHHPVRSGAPGLVELWPLATHGERDDGEPWQLPLAEMREAPPAQRLAALVARRIWQWTSAPEEEADAAGDSFLAARGRRMRPGDVLVLVRRRNQFVQHLVRELKGLGVPVAGVDRMRLTEQLAVEDLIALGRVLLLPEDDLALATVLKGPFLGFGEDELFALAHGRRGRLWQALKLADDESCRRASAWLRDLMGRADFMTPASLYAYVLGSLGGRRALLRRLGEEAREAIDEFLNLALAYERDHVPSLEGFLHWLEATETDIRRDMEHGLNAVRIMTVHGAKGLEAPVVILPDTVQLPPSPRGLLWLKEELPLWVPRSDLHGDVSRRAQQLVQETQEEEYRRLLYVAMTRAEDRLYVCGWQSRNSNPSRSWYDLIARGLSEIPAAAPFAFEPEIEGPWEGPALRLKTGEGVARRPSPSPAPQGEPLPAWTRRSPDSEPHPPRPLAPSRSEEGEPPAVSPAAPGRARRRGAIVHRLLQHLPDLAPEVRPAAARRLAALASYELPPEAQEEIVAETLAVLQTREAGFLFAPGGLAEVPVAGTLQGRGGPQVVFGQVDRLIVGEDGVAVVDYKTNRRAPARESEVPALYLRQMATYRAVLSLIYPQKEISCYLLWTEGPRLMHLSPALLEAHEP